MAGRDEPVSAPSSSARSGAGFELRLERGGAYVRLADQPLAPGLRLESLTLQIPDVKFPFDVGQGSGQFRHRLADLVELSVTVEPALAEAALAEAGLAAFGVEDVRLALRDGFLEVAGRLSGGPPFTLAAGLLPHGEQGVALVFHSPRVLGSAALAGAALPHLARAVLDAIGPERLPLEPLAPILRRILAGRGWKLPRTGEARLARAELAGGVVRLAWSRAASGPAIASASPELLAADEGARAFREAEAHLARGDAAAARDAYLAAGPAAATHPFAAERLLSLLALEDRFQEEALDLSAEWLSRRPGFPPALVAEATVRLARGEDARAARTLAVLAEVAAGRGEAFLALTAAEAAYSLPGAATADALRAVETALGLRRDHVPALRALAALARAADDKEALLRASRRLVAYDPDLASKARAHAELGELLLVADPPGARLHLDHALRLAPEDPDALASLARACAAAGEPLRAVRALDRLREAHLARGERALAARAALDAAALWEGPLSHPENALLRLREACELAPSAEGHARAARAAEAVGQWTEAADHHGAVLAVAGDAAPGAAALALASRLALADVAERRLADPAAAAAHLAAAAALAPDDPSLLRRLVALERALGRAEGLLAALDRLAKLEPDAALRAALLAEAGGAARALRRPEDARSRLAAAAAADPTCLPALLGLAELARERGDAGAERDALARLLALPGAADDRPALQERLADAAERAGDLESALAAARAAREAAPSPARLEALLRLARRAAGAGEVAALLAERAADALAAGELAVATAALRERADLLAATSPAEALAALAEARAASPGDAAVLRAQAELAERTRDPRLALDALGALVALAPPDAAALALRAAEAALTVEDLAAARAHAQRALEAGAPGAAELLDALLERLGDDRARAELLDRLGRHLEAALLHERDGDAERARLALERAARDPALAAEALPLLADSRLEAGDGAGAARALRDLAKLVPPGEGARIALRAHALGRDPAALDLAVELDPRFAPARARRARLRAGDDPRGALVDAEAALAGEGLDEDERPELLVVAAGAAAAAGDGEAARRLLTAYCDAQPDDDDALARLAALHRAGGDAAGLAAALARRLPHVPEAEAVPLRLELAHLLAASDPSGAERLAEAALAALAAGRDEGEPALHRALALGPSRETARAALEAIVARARARGDAAAERDALPRLVPLLPTGARPAALLRLASLALAAGDEAAARASAEEARALAPRDPGAVHACHAAALAAGDLPRAAELLAALAELEPADAGRHLLERARLLASLGEDAAADAAFTAALAALPPDRALADAHARHRRERLGGRDAAAPLEAYARRAADPRDAARALRVAAATALAAGNPGAALRCARGAYARTQDDLAFAAPLLARLLYLGGATGEALVLHRRLLDEGLPGVAAEDAIVLCRQAAELAEDAGEVDLALGAHDRLLALRPQDTDAALRRFSLDPDRVRAVHALASAAEASGSERRSALALARAAAAALRELGDGELGERIFRRAREVARDPVLGAAIARERAAALRAVEGPSSPAFLAAVHDAAAAAQAAGDRAVARELLAQAVAAERERGELSEAARDLLQLDALAAAEGEFAESAVRARSAATLLREAGDLDGALEVLRSAWAADPDSGETGRQLEEVARALGERGVPALVELLADRAARAEPGAAQASALVALADAHLAAGAPREAEAALRAALAEDAGLAGAQARLLVLCPGDAELAARARLLLERADRSEDRDAARGWRRSAAELLGASQDPADRALAADAWAAVASEDPADLAAARAAALLLLDLGRREEALPLLAGVLRADPDDADAARALAGAHADRHRERGELFVYRAEGASGDARAERLREAARAFFAAGDDARARDVLREVEDSPAGGDPAPASAEDWGALAEPEVAIVERDGAADGALEADPGARDELPEGDAAPWWMDEGDEHAFVAPPGAEPAFDAPEAERGAQEHEPDDPLAAARAAAARAETSEDPGARAAAWIASADALARAAAPPGDVRAALDLACDADPDSPAPWRARARLETALGDPLSAARAHLAASIRAEGEDAARAALEAARLFEAAERHGDALRAYRAALHAMPGCVPADAFGAAEALAAGDVPAAAERLARLDPATLPAAARAGHARKLAQALAAAGRVDEAERAWREILDASPGDGEAFAGAAALALAARGVDGWLELAVVHEQALAAWGSLEQRRDLRLERGRRLAEEGRLEAARGALLAALELDPAHPATQGALAALDGRREDWATAAAALWAEGARATDGAEAAAIHLRLARILAERLADHAGAIAALRAALARAAGAGTAAGARSAAEARALLAELGAASFEPGGPATEERAPEAADGVAVVLRAEADAARGAGRADRLEGLAAHLERSGDRAGAAEALADALEADPHRDANWSWLLALAPPDVLLARAAAARASAEAEIAFSDAAAGGGELAREEPAGPQAEIAPGQGVAAPGAAVVEVHAPLAPLTTRDPAEYARDGRLRLEAGDLAGAYERLSIGLARDPSDLGITRDLMRVTERLGLFDEYVQLGEVCADAIGPHDPLAAAARFRHFAEVLRDRLGQIDRAGVMLEKALSLVPEDADTRRELVQIWTSRPETAPRALERWQDLARSDPADGAALAGIAEVCGHLASSGIAAEAVRAAERGRIAASMAAFASPAVRAAPAPGALARGISAELRARVAAPGATGPLARLLRLLAPWLEPLFPADLARRGASPSAPLAPGDAPELQAALAGAAGVLWARPHALLLSSRPGVAISLENTQPPSIVATTELARLSPSSLAFVTARALDLLEHGWALAGKFAPADVGILLELACRFAGGSPPSRGLPEARAGAFLAALDAQVPAAARAAAEELGAPAALELADTDPRAFVAALRRTASRVALLYTGDPGPALHVLALLDRRLEAGPLDPAQALALPDLRDLALFALSDPFLELRAEALR